MDGVTAKITTFENKNSPKDADMIIQQNTNDAIVDLNNNSTTSNDDIENKIPNRCKKMANNIQPVKLQFDSSDPSIDSYTKIANKSRKRRIHNDNTAVSAKAIAALKPSSEETAYRMEWLKFSIERDKARLELEKSRMEMERSNRELLELKELAALAEMTADPVEKMRLKNRINKHVMEFLDKNFPDTDDDYSTENNEEKKQKKTKEVKEKSFH